MAITLEQAKNLRYGQTVYHATETYENSNERLKFTVNGKPKTWKRDATRIKVPIKYGLYEYGEITNGTNCQGCRKTPIWEGNHFTISLDDVSLV